MNSSLTLEQKHEFDSHIGLHHLARKLTQVHRYPEVAHGVLLKILKLTENSALSPLHQEHLIRLGDRLKDEWSIGPVTMQHRMILPAGFIKNPALIPKNITDINVGAICVGGITVEPRQGNPRPRKQILADVQGARNWMGLNNIGAKEAASTLDQMRKAGKLPACPIFLNLATVTTSPGDELMQLIRELWTHCDVIEYNASCPNTEVGASLLKKYAELGRILQQAQVLNHGLASMHQQEPKPILLKLSPDLSREEIEAIIDTTQAHVDGYTTGNTSTDYSHLPLGEWSHSFDKGGISGHPILTKQQTTTRTVRDILGDEGVVIATGGIGTYDPTNTLDSEVEQIITTGTNAARDGADAIGVYSGLLLNGPSAANLALDGFMYERRQAKHS